MKFTAVFSILSVAAMVAAAPTLDARTDGTSCTNAGGQLSCCNQVQTKGQLQNSLKGNPALGGVLNPILSLIPDLTAQLGVSCTPIVDLVSVPSCVDQTVCCQAPNSPSTSPALISILSGNSIPICPVVGL